MTIDHGELDEALPDGLDLALDDGPGPARRLTPAQSAALIAGALDAWQGAAPASTAPSATTAASRLPWMVAAASMLVAVASVAAMTIVLTREPPPPAPDLAAPLPPPVPEPVPEPEPDSASDPAPASDSASDSASAPEASASDPRPTTSRRRATPAPRTPDDLLAEANAHRAAGRWREAEATYARVPREHPGSFSAYVAQVAAADVRLAHLRDPRGALRLYRTALASRPGGPLDVEAREGIARALRRTGDEDGERDALRALIAAHPSTAAAVRARARLEELGSSTR